jgi:hypothetical protein
MLRDLYNTLTLIGGVAAAPADNTAVVSPIVDTRAYRSILFAIATGTLADADATFTALLEEGDAADLSDAAAVADADMIGTEAAAGFTFADDSETRKLGYIGNKRYVRLTLTPANNTGAAPIGVIAMGVPFNKPAA